MTNRICKFVLVTLLLVMVTTLLFSCNKAVEYTVYFDVDGTTYATVFTSGNQAIEIPANPTKEGYTFGGWYWDKDEWERPFTANSLLDAPISANMTVYAKWVPKGEEPGAITYTITFNSNGGGNVAAITKAAGTSITAPTPPTKANHTFGGWFIDNNTFANEYTFGTMPAQSFTLYAKWTENPATTYTITFSSNGGGNVAAITQAAGTSITAPTPPTKANHTFGGWFIDNNTFANEYTFGTMPAESFTLYAKWTENRPSTTYTVTFDGNGGILISGNAVQTIEHGQGAIAPVFTKEGYTLSWDKAFDNVNEATTVTAVWSIKTYAVTFDGNGGTLISGSATQTIEHGGAAIAPVYEKEGYDLSWDKTFNNITGTVTITAVWTIKSYTLTFNSNEGSAVDPITQAAGTSITAPTPPTKSGYNFGGWYTDDITFNNVYTFDVMPTEDIALYAKWTQLYTIAFDSNGGSAVAPVTKGAGERIPAPAPPTKEGHVFDRWYTDNDTFLNAYNFITMPAQDIILYAKWIPETQGLSYVLINNDTQYEVSGIGTATETEINIASTYDGKPVTSIGVSAFEDCSSLTSVILPDSVTSIGEWAFYGCSGLTSITLLSGVTSIGYGAFYNCNGLTSITIPDSITSIGSNAFYGCTSLTSATIPAGITSIGDAAFSGCGSLASIFVNATTPPILGSSAFSDNANGRKIYVPAARLSVYKAANNWSSYASGIYSQAIIDENGFAIENGALIQYVGNAATIIVPNCVTSINNYAFCNCIELTSITIPNSVTSIGSSAFSGCGGLTSIVLPFVGASKSTTSSNALFGYIFGTSSYTGGTAVTQYYLSNSSTTYYIPSSLRTVTVAGGELKYGAFYGCSMLTSVTIGSSVTSIGSNAFSGCSGLTSVTIGNSVTSIGSRAFAACSGLTVISIGNGVTSIGEYALSGCSGLTSITLPFVGTSKTATSSDAVFGYIFGTSSYTGGTAVTQYYASGSSTTYYIPSSLRSVTVTGGTLKYGAFYGCSMLTSIAIPDSVTSIGERAFYGCHGLTSIAMPSSVTSIGSYAFYSCSGLTSITIPFVGSTLNGTGNTDFGYIFGGKYTVPFSLKTVIITGGTSIGVMAFEDCSGLTSITIPDSVTSIGHSAFFGCSGLTSITIPDSVTSIGYSAFYGTEWLNNQPDGLVYAGKVAYKYKGTMPANTEIVLLNGTKSITDNAFYGCSGLTSITIPDSVTSIGGSAFYNCSGLTSITIPDSVTSIGSSAFSNCRGLTAITIPDGVTSIGGYTFSGCSGLTSVTIGGGVTSIGVEAFYVCSGLTSVTIGNGVTSIGDHAFFGCSGLTSITIPDSVTSIGSRAFTGCSGLTVITIGNGVTRIGEYAFYGCSGLTSITLPFVGASNTATGSDAVFGYIFGTSSYTGGTAVTQYYASGSSTTYYIPSSLRTVTVTGGTLQYGAFYGCSMLTSITIPDNVTSIGQRAFGGCSGLTSITIPFVGETLNGTSNTHFGYIFGASSYSSNSYFVPASLKTVTIAGGSSIGNYAFQNCSGLTSITIPDSVTSIGSDAFSGCSGLTSMLVNSGNTIYHSDGNCLIKTASKNLILGCRNSTIPTDDSVTSIGYKAFSGCDGLTAITIPDSVTSIGAWAFENCSGLTAITIGNGVTSIGNGAFSGCSGLTSITLPFVGATLNGTSNTHFGYIFGASSYSNNSSSVPVALKTATVTGGSIGNNAFYNCSMLTSVTILDGVTSIGNDAFYGTAWYNNQPDGLVYAGKVAYKYKGTMPANTEIVLLNGTKDIAEYAFSGCSGLTSITISDSVTSIGEGAFSGCTATIVWGESSAITEIANFAFSGYAGASISIPDSVTSIGSNAFYNCSGLTSMTLPFVGTNKTATGSSTLFGYIFGTSSYTGGTAVTQYYASGLTTYYIPSNLRTVTVTGGTLKYGAFYGCSMLTSITIPDSVTSIGDWTFYNCSGLTSVTIGNSVTSIGNSAFDGCSGLTSVTIPDSVTSIGSLAFANCSGLISAHLSDIAAWCGISFSSSYSNPLNCANELYLNGVLVTDLVIPDSVTSIGSYAFSGCSGLTSITIPDSVTSIGGSAFYNCSGLTSITIPDSVTSIGEYAFEDCRGLTAITIPDGVTSIGGYTFSGCSGLTSITIGNGVTSIGELAFYNCSGLTSITIGNGVTSIGELAFYNCSGLTSITIGNGVTSIGAGAFSGCSGLTSVTIPDSVTSIGEGAFSGCNKLKRINSETDGIFVIPDSVTSIGAGAFSSCSGLTSITLPFVGASKSATGSSPLFGYIFGTSSYTGGTAVTQYYVSGSSTTYYIPSSLRTVTVTGGTLQYGAFFDCSILTSVTISDGVTSIGERAFFRCSGLTSVTIFDGVTSIGQYAFSGCSGLTSITLPFVGASKTATSSNALFGYIFGTSSYTGGAAVTQYYVGSSTTYYIPSNLRTVTVTGDNRLGYGVFYGCSMLTSITIPDGVTSIGDNAFSGCSGLPSVTIPYSVTSIGSHAFSGCNKLKRINSETDGIFVIPDSVTSIGAGAFSGCSGLTSITLPFVGASKSATGSSPLFGYIFGTSSYTGGTAVAQYYAGSSTTYYIPSSLRTVTVTGGTLQYGAFHNCSMLTSVTISDSVTSIEERAFFRCSGLTSVTIPGSVTSIGNEAFFSCSGLTSVTIPDSVTSIGSSVFRDCSGLTSVTIGNSVTSIGDYAFYGCSMLTSVTIPDSVTSIGYYVFNSCSGLTSISVDSGNTVYHSTGNCLINIATKTLILGCKNSEIPNDGSVTCIGSDAFYGCSGLTSITIPDSVTSIGSSAFRGCSGLTSITIPDSVTSIEERAFFRCSGLTSVTIPGSVTSIGNEAFFSCSGLTSVTIPDSVTSIGSSVFRDCSGLTSVTFQNTSGWYVTQTSGASSGTSLSVTNTSTNATYLKTTYYYYYWYRKLG